MILSKKIIDKVISNKSMLGEIRFIDKKELKNYADLYEMSFLRKVKILIKRLIFRFLYKMGFKELVYNKARSTTNVKKKYDDISGSYIKKFEDKKKTNKGYLAYDNRDKSYLLIKKKPIDHPSYVLGEFYKKFDCESVIEVGAGELTTFYNFVNKISNKSKLGTTAALDLSTKRLLKGKEFLKKKNIDIDYLISSNATNIPLPDNSFDLVFSHNCIEQAPMIAQNIIDEMVRISSNIIIFIEPSFEFGNQWSRNKILGKGYPIFTKRSFKNKYTDLIFRNGLPFTRCENFSEIVILKKKNNKKNKINLKNNTFKEYIDKKNSKFMPYRNISGVLEFY
jgi:ubiquinone/menaquinone biosynthesis C-methylase UbiE